MAEPQRPDHESGLGTNDEVLGLIESEEADDPQLDELNMYLMQLQDETQWGELDDFTAVSEKTALARERMWFKFCEFFERRKNPIDPESIWLGLCQDDLQSKKYCQAFLLHYVKVSMDMKPKLHGTGFEVTPSITSGSTVIKMWRGLIGYVNEKILIKKRKEEPHNFWKWSIKFSDVKQGRLSGPVSQITNWIESKLVDETGLSREQLFEKRQATSEDVILILSTLWRRAADIQFCPRLRVAFHSALLLCAIGGFRMGVVQEIKYEQVQLAFVRGSEKDKLKLVATITLYQNKRRKNKIETSQDHTLSLSITFVPCKILCLLSLLAATALADNAFEVPFDSIKTLLSRPRLEPGVNYFPLKWKDEILGRSIIDISYDQYWQIWQRTVFITGVRESIRPYATRVGAGQRLDAVLEPALRNYLLSNSQKTFERNYQPRHISFDLAKVTFSDIGDTSGTEKLYQLLGQACMARDEKAPIYLNMEEQKQLNSHSHILSLREEYRKANAQWGRNDSVTQRAQLAMRYGQRQLEERMIEEKREKYFDEADRLRALGEPVEKAFPDANDPAKLRPIVLSAKQQLGINGTKSISEFMHRDDLCGEKHHQNFVDMIFEYLAHRAANADYMFRDIVERAGGEIPRPVTPVLEAEEGYRCLFGCSSLNQRNALTTHTASCHKESFNTPFYCPECRRRRFPPVIIESLDHWCVHAERAHGKANAPSYRPKFRHDGFIKRFEKPSKAACLFCRAEFCVGQGYARHFKKHAEKEFAKTQGFDCPKCQRDGKGLVRIVGRDSWLLHAREVHQIDGIRGTAPDGSIQKKVAPPATRREKKRAVRRESTKLSESLPHNISSPIEIRETDNEAASNSDISIDLMDHTMSERAVSCSPDIDQEPLEVPPQLTPNGSDNQQTDVQGILDLQEQADVSMEPESTQLGTDLSYQPGRQQNTRLPTPVPFQIGSSISENTPMVPIPSKDESHGSCTPRVQPYNQHNTSDELEFNPW